MLPSRSEEWCREDSERETLGVPQLNRAEIGLHIPKAAEPTEIEAAKEILVSPIMKADQNRGIVPLPAKYWCAAVATIRLVVCATLARQIALPSISSRAYIDGGTGMIYSSPRPASRPAHLVNRFVHDGPLFVKNCEIRGIGIDHNRAVRSHTGPARVWVLAIRSVKI